MHLVYMVVSFNWLHLDDNSWAMVTCYFNGNKNDFVVCLILLFLSIFVLNIVKE
jgi:hypothetical protein